MEKITNYTKNELDRELQKSFALSLKNPEFTKLVNSLKLEEKNIMKYTSRLEDTVKDLENCKGCKSIHECKNRMCGFVTYPTVVEDRLEFSYMPCKHKRNENTHISYFEVPLSLKNATMKGIKATAKERIEVIKYMKEIISTFDRENFQKGIYLHGSFGSGKSYLMSALINELSKKYKLSAVIMYYPTLLKTLKSSFNDEFDSKLDEISKCDLLLIDDIGAERNTEWARDEILGPILQYRMDNDLLTFFTSNYTIDELLEHLSVTKESTDKVKGRRIIERIKYLTREIELTAKDMRNS